MKKTYLLSVVFSILIVIIGFALAFNEKINGVTILYNTFIALRVFIIWLPILLILISIVFLYIDLSKKYVLEDSKFIQLWFPITTLVYASSISFVYIVLNEFLIIPLMIYLCLLAVFLYMVIRSVKLGHFKRILELSKWKYYIVSYMLSITMFVFMFIMFIISKYSSGGPH